MLTPVFKTDLRTEVMVIKAAKFAVTENNTMQDKLVGSLLPTL